MVRKSAFVVVALIMAAVLVGCNGNSLTTAYKTGAASKTLYDTALLAMGELYQEGLLTEEVKSDVVYRAKIYKDLHNMSVEALIRYKESQEETDLNEYLTLANQASLLLADFLNYCRPFLVEHGKEAI